MPTHVDEIGVINLIPFGRSTYTDANKNCVNDPECKQYMDHVSLYLN